MHQNLVGFDRLEPWGYSPSPHGEMGREVGAPVFISFVN